MFFIDIPRRIALFPLQIDKCTFVVDYKVLDFATK